MDTSGAAVIDGITGPGKRVQLVVGNVDEITFRFKKQVIDVTNNRGELGSYDLAQVNSILVNADDKKFSLSIQSIPEVEDGSEAAADARNARPETKAGTTPGRQEPAAKPVSGGTNQNPGGANPKV